MKSEESQVDLERVVAGAFRERFGEAARWIVRAPGRANIIGEHTDYNGGLVLPFAVAPSVVFAVAPSDDSRVRVASLDFDGDADFALPDAAGSEPAPSGWSASVHAVLSELARLGHRLEGMRILAGSDVPIGAGLSSSSAFEVAVVLAAQVRADLSMDDWAIVTCCQGAESRFLGVNSGLMDPFASRFGREGHALLLDNSTRAWRAVPLTATWTEDLEFLVIDSGFRRCLAATGYNQRRSECEAAVARLQDAGAPTLETLSDLKLSDLEVACAVLPELESRRVRHVVEENERVRAVVAGLERGDAVAVGQALDASHASLRDLFEVSHPGIDEWIAELQERDEVLGARIMGAGFGGSLIALVRRGAARAIRDDLLPIWATRYATRPRVLCVEPAPGAAVSDVSP